MRPARIPFNRPRIVGKELKYIAEAIRDGHISGNGHYSKKCEALLEKLMGVRKVLLTTSCTHALEIAAFLLNIRPGDEVIVPSYTFVTTVNAFVIRGATPVFIDIRKDTLNLDESKLERLISKKTRAIVTVHYAGVGCEMDVILSIAKKYGIPVVEDNAHGLLGRYRSRPLGSFGAMATQSFHETKNFICGEGGALIINDPKYIERAEIIREKGTDRSRFIMGKVDKYTWRDVGSSYVLSDLLAAYLYAQLECHQSIQAQRKRIWDFYEQHLRGWSESNGVRMPYVPSHCEQSYHMFYLIMPSELHRNALIDHLEKSNINSVFHYAPLHLSEMGRRIGKIVDPCDCSKDTSERLLRLPFYNELTQTDQQRVIQCIKAYQCTRQGIRARTKIKSARTFVPGADD